MKAESIEQTCHACPAQFEGQLDTGEYFYGRYRWGCLSIRIGDSPDKAVRGREVYCEQLSGDFDGDMTLNRFEDILRSI